MTAKAVKSVLKSSEVRGFYTALQSAKVSGDPEKAVEAAVNAVIRSYFTRKYSEGYEVTHSYPHNTDGVIKVQSKNDDLFSSVGDVAQEFSILIETKRDMILSGNDVGRKNRARVAAQVVYYLKHFQKAGDQIPTAIVIADVDEILVLPTSSLLPYLSKDYDWNIAPSKAADLNIELFTELFEDPNLQSHVELIDKGFDVDYFCREVESFATNSANMVKLRVDTHSLEKAFLDFQRLVFGGEAFETKRQMSVFVNSMLGSDNVFLNPNKKNELMILVKDHKGNERVERYPDRNQVFDGVAYKNFLARYDRHYGYEERKAITEIADTLFDDFERRFTGDFWTPKIWVDEAHKMIEEQLGSDWKDKYVVWDPACGSKNLTRDYKFAELYTSTLHQDELNIAEDYNKEGTAFQYDFLNDDMEIHELSKGLLARKPSEMSHEEREQFILEQQGKWKLPDGLIRAFVENKPIVFLGNPPYGQPSNGMKNDGSAVKMTGQAKNSVSIQMKGMGRAATELCTQFIYRVQMLAKTFGYTQDFFFFFFNKGFFTSPSFGKFVNELTSEFAYRDGFMLNAGEFSGTASSWGIVFSGWEIDSSNVNPPALMFDVRQSNNGGGDEKVIEKVTDWAAKRVDNTIVKFGNDKIRAIKTFPKGSYPETKNGFESTYSSNGSLMKRGQIGYLARQIGTVQSADKYTYLASMNASIAGIPVCPENFVHSAVMFSAQKSWFTKIAAEKLLWVRDKDIFPAPTPEFQASSEWNEFSNDCVVYSLFASGSNQTSLRDYQYGTNDDSSPRKWRVNNEFFWRTKAEVETLAQEHKFYEIEQDAQNDNERYVATYLNDKELSEEARSLLSIVNRIHEHSFKYRKAFNYEQPKFNLMTWDSGWLQIYKMCFAREALPAAKADTTLQAMFDEFKTARRALGDKIAARYSQDTGF